MASIYDLKPRFQNLLRPIASAMAQKGVTANQVTVCACILSLVTAALMIVLFEHPIIFLIVPLVLFVRMALNAIDGMLAREHNQASRLGAILNEVCDVISDTALSLAFIPYLQLVNVPVWPLVCFTLLAVFNEFCGLLGHAVGAGRRYEGPGGKSDRALILGIFATVIAIFGLESAGMSLFTLGMFAVTSVLIALSCWNRLRAALKEGQS